MLKIQRVAQGLIEYLNLRSQGETPDELSRVVSPTLDLELMYDLQDQIAVQEPIGMVDGQIEFIEVPDDEIWKLISVAVTRDPSSPAGGNQNAAFKFSIENVPGTGLFGVAFADVLATRLNGTGANSLMGASFMLPRPFLVNSGQRITITQKWSHLSSTNAPFTWVGDFWVHAVRLRR